MRSSSEKGPGPIGAPQAQAPYMGPAPKQLRRRLRGLKLGVGPGLLGCRNECLRLFAKSEARTKDLFDLVDAVAGPQPQTS
eukprot:6374231-Alexandrium_andersonii.AAC.1